MFHYNPKINEFLLGLEKEGVVITKKTENDFSVTAGNKKFMINTSDYNKTRKINYDIPNKKSGGFIRISLRILQVISILRILYLLYTKIVNGGIVPEDKKAREEYHRRQKEGFDIYGLINTASNIFF